MIAHVALLLCLVAGCDTVFDLERTTDAPPDQPPQVCPSTYTKVRDTYYRFEITKTSWLDAEMACMRDGAGLGMSTHLAVPTTISEVNDVYDQVHTRGGDYAWVGLDNRANTPATCDAATDYNFQWVTDEPAPVPPSHQPPWNSADPMLVCTQQCVRILTNPQLDNSACTNMHGYVCECDGFPDDPAHR